MTRPPLEVADLIRAAGTAFIERNRQWLRWTHIKVLRAIARDRDARLGVYGSTVEPGRVAGGDPVVLESSS